jgi:predicted metal-dependent peptidase
MKKLLKARAGLLLDNPFFGSIAMRLILKEDNTCETAYTDGEVLGYNLEFIEALPMPQLKGLIAHEVMHIALSHHGRVNGRDMKRWNVAADYAVNDILIESGFTLPDGALFGHKDMTAEAIYTLIPEQEKRDGGMCGEVREGKNAADSLVTIAQAAQQARGAGKLPASIARLVGDLMAPKNNWADILRRFVSQVAKNDYSWAKPNRRFIHSGSYFPSLYSLETGKIVIAIDTSGSIDKEALTAFQTELNDINEVVNADITVVYCDKEIHGVETYNGKFNPIGGGGTSYKPVFDYQYDACDCLIYFTDGDCYRFPDFIPDYPVLWVLSENFQFNPPFGEQVKMS